jgi:hypothetical protein
MTQLDTFLVQRRELIINHVFENRQQSTHFSLRTPPILGRECVDGQHRNAEPNRGSENAAQVLRACAMSRQPGQALCLSPAAITIHYDTHVPRQTLQRWKTPVNLFLRGHLQPDAS